VTTALPTQVTYGTFKGRLIDAINTGSGEVSRAVTGTVTASPAVNSVNIPAALVVMLPRPVTVTLDANGAFTMQLVATDDPALSIINWAYQISFQLGNGDALAPFLVQIPGGSTVDLSTANPVSTGGGVAITQGLAGPAGPTALFDADAVPYLNATAPAPTGPGVQPANKRLVTEASTYFERLPELVATNHGMKCDNLTDDTAALTALIAKVNTAGGGTIAIPALARINGQVVFPNDGGSQSRQAPIRIRGQVQNAPGQTQSGGPQYPALGGFDLRYAGASRTGCATTLGSAWITDPGAVAADYGQIVLGPGIGDRAYILGVVAGSGYALSVAARATATVTLTVTGGRMQTLGIGHLELEHLQLVNGGSSSSPAVITTGTTVHMHDCQVVGSAAKATGTADEDPVVMGGPGQGTLLTAALVSGTAYTTLAVAPLPVSILPGGIGVYLNYGCGQTQQVFLAARAAEGATTLTVTSFTANANYPVNTSVFIGGQQDAVGPGCWAVPSAPFQGYGTHITDNHFQRVRRIRQEAFASDILIDQNEWMHDCASNLAAVPCKLTAALVSGTAYTTLAVGAIPRAVVVGDTIQLGIDAGASQTLTATAASAAGTTSITVASFTAARAYAVGVKVLNINDGIGAPVESYAAPGSANSLVVGTNRFEMAAGYSYGTRFEGQTYGTLAECNNFQDSTPATIACHRFGPGASFNTILTGLLAYATDGSFVPITDDQANAGSPAQTVITAAQSRPSRFPQGLITQGDASQWVATPGASYSLAPRLIDPNGNYWQDSIQGGTSRIGSYTTAAGVTTNIYLVTVNGTSSRFGLPSANSYIENVDGHFYFQCKNYYKLYLGDPDYPTSVYVNNGQLFTAHTVAIGAVPTVAAAGGSTPVAVTGQDTAMTVTLTTAAALAADASVATVAFNYGWASRNAGILPRFALTPKNGASQGAGAFITGDSATGFSIALHTPPAAATALAFDVTVIGA